MFNTACNIASLDVDACISSVDGSATHLPAILVAILLDVDAPLNCDTARISVP